MLLPGYAFDRKPCWAEPVPQIQNISETTFSNSVQSIVPNQIEQMSSTNNISVSRKEAILDKISDIILNTSGIELETSDYDYSFIELGLDSLVLTQMAITCKNEFGTVITFRQLNDAYGSPNLLASYLDETLPQEQFAQETSIQNTEAGPKGTAVPITNVGNSTLDVIAKQLKLLSDQVNQLQGKGNITQTPIIQKAAIPNLVKNAKDLLSEEEKKEHSKPFGASPKIDKKVDGLTPEQKVFLDLSLIHI